MTFVDLYVIKEKNKCLKLPQKNSLHHNIFCIIKQIYSLVRNLLKARLRIGTNAEQSKTKRLKNI